MANLTRIKILTTSATAAAPSNIYTGELAYSYVGGSQANNGDRLYIGTGNESPYASTVSVIGGKYFTDMLDHVHGTATASSALILNGNKHVNEFNTAALKIAASGALGAAVAIDSIKDEDNMSSNSNTALATQQSIKAYVDAQVTLQDLDVAGDSGTGAVDLDSQSLTIAGDTGLTTSASGQTITIDLDDTAVSAGSYGSQTAIPVITVDAQGRLTSASTVALATALTVDGDSGTGDVALLTDDLRIVGTSNEIVTAAAKSGTDVTVTVGLPDDVTIGSDLLVTDNLTVNGNVNLGNGSSDTVTTSGSMTVGGNLTVNGTQTTLNSTTVTVDDPIFVVGGDTAPSSDDNLDRGLEFRWHNGSAAKLGFFGFDDSTGKFTFIPDATDTSGVITGTKGQLDVGGVKANTVQVGVTANGEIDTSSGNLTIDSAGGTTTIDDALVVSGAVTLSAGAGLSVGQGGTGKRSITANAIIVGNGTSAPTERVSSAAGNILQGAANGTVSWSSIIDGGTY